jgi:hypothetical protein
MGKYMENHHQNKDLRFFLIMLEKSPNPSFLKMYGKQSPNGILLVFLG